MNNHHSFPRRLAFGCCILLILLSIDGRAQRVNQIAVNTFTGNWSSIKGQGATTVVATFGSQVISYSYSFAMPFAFKYDDNLYPVNTTAYLNPGSVGFNSANPSYNSIVGNASYHSKIVALSGLHTTRYTGGNSTLLRQVSGSAPNRVLTIEWDGMGNYYMTELGVTSYQIKLYESTNVIEFIYKDHNFTMNNSSYASYTKSSGLNGRNTPSFVFRSIMSGTIKTPSADYRFGQPPPNVQLTSYPKMVNFGSGVTGSDLFSTVTVSNVGSDENGVAKLSIKSVSITGAPEFTVIAAPASGDSMLIGETRTILLKFSPQFDGQKQATLSIVSNGLDSATQTIALTGIGLAPLISIDTNVLFKNKFTRMGESMVAKVVITSTNIPTLNINDFQFVGEDADQYSIAQGPSSMQILGGQSDSIFVRYTPTKEGRHTATLNILNNSLNNPTLPVTLWGTAKLPHITVTPSKLLFDSVAVGMQVCKTIRIYNPGTDSLMILSNSVTSNDGDYAYTGIVGKDSIIPPDKYRDVTFCFTPIQKGIRQAALRLTTNIPKTFEATPRDTAGNILIAIEGTGVPQGLLTHSLGDEGFSDSVIVGKKACKSATISNQGEADIILTGWTISDPTFSATGINFPYLLKAKSTRSIDLCATAPTIGETNGSLKLTGTVSEKPITLNIPLAIYGLKICADASPDNLFDGHLVLENTDSAICVDVTNCGDVPTDYTASLPSGTDYTISGTNPSGVIAPGAKATFCIHFNPKTMGEAKTTLTITPSTSELAPLAIPVGGVGACAEPTAAPLTVNPMGKGGHGPFTITVKNNGNFDWTPGTAVITPNDGVFMLDGPVPAIAAGATQNVTGTFNPTDNNKTYSASITFPQAAPSQCAALTLTLTGQSDASGVASKTEEAGFSLGQNYPNPFASVTTFNFTTPTEAQIVLSISDLTGRQIKVITSGNVSSGEHTVQFDASTLSSGSYIITLESGAIRLARQIVVAR